MLSGYKYLEIHNVISGGKRNGPMKRSRCEFLAKGDSVLKQEALPTCSGSRQGHFSGARLICRIITAASA